MTDDTSSGTTEPGQRSFNLILFFSYAGLLVVCLVVALRDLWGSSGVARGLVADDHARLAREADALVPLLFGDLGATGGPATREALDRGSLRLRSFPGFDEAARVTLYDAEGRALVPAGAPPLPPARLANPRLVTGRALPRLLDEGTPEDSPVSFLVPLDADGSRRFLEFVLPPTRGRALLRALGSGQNTSLVLVLSIICWSSLGIVFVSHRRLRAQYEVATRYAAELRQAQDALVEHEKVRALTQAAGGLAHELNQPLGVVKGYCELLRMTTDPATVASYTETIESQIDRAAAVIDRLQNVMRVKTLPYVGEAILDIRGSTGAGPQEPAATDRPS